MLKHDDRLSASTVKVYVFLLKKGESAGVREVQRAMGFKSPSVAYYHLNKLIELELVKQDQYGAYLAERKVDASALGPFLLLGSIIVPRFVFYAAFFTTFLAGYLLVYRLGASVEVISVSALASIFFWIEAALAWRRRSF
jgi:DNA-binding transcriptional ArsR family regulator